MGMPIPGETFFYIWTQVVVYEHCINLMNGKIGVLFTDNTTEYTHNSIIPNHVDSCSVAFHVAWYTMFHTYPDVTDTRVQSMIAQNTREATLTSSNGNIFCVIGYLCGGFTGRGWIPRTKGQWRGALMFSLICAWINCLLNNLEAGDLRRKPIMTSL